MAVAEPQQQQQTPQIPGYRIEGQIGKGGMGVVYRATQLALDRDVAIKVLPPHLANDDEFVVRFAAEAKTTANLHHPSIVSVHDFGPFPGGYFLSMQYVEGRTLHQVLHVRRPAMEEVLGIVQQIAGALDYAHGKGVIHRDIKPANIMLCPDGTAMLMDFGVALGMHTPPMPPPGASNTHLGTPHYMSPEQCQGEELDRRSDVYALGAVLYQLLTGHPPFEGHNSAALMYQHVHTPPPSPRSVRAEISPHIEAVVLRALEKAPEKRYQSAGALYVALDIAFRAPVKSRTTPGFAVPAAPSQMPGAPAATGAAPLTVAPAQPAPPGPACLVGSTAEQAGLKPAPLPIQYRTVQRSTAPLWLWVGAAVCALVILGAVVLARVVGSSGASAPPAATKPARPHSRIGAHGHEHHHARRVASATAPPSGAAR